MYLFSPYLKCIYIWSIWLGAVFSQECNVMEHGAIGDGMTDDTMSIQSVIDDLSCSSILLPKGNTFISGSIFLRSNLEFIVDGELLGSPDYKNKAVWPNIYTRRAGLMVNTTASLVNGGQCLKMIDGYIARPPYIHGDQCEEWNILTNVSLHGEGVINGNGNCGWATDESTKSNRPTLLGLGHITGLEIFNLLLTNPAFWTCHVLFSENVHIHDLKIDTSSEDTVNNADGIDPDSSKNVLIEDCTVTSNDDVIAIKSGINEDGRAVGIPSQNITVRNMYFEQGRGISIGSETSGDIRDIFISDIKMNGTERGVRIKSQAGRGGVVKNIVYERIEMTDVSTAISITMEYYDGVGPLPTFENIIVKDIVGDSIQQCGEIVCEKRSKCTGMLFENITLNAADGYTQCQYVEGIQENVYPSIPCIIE